MGEAELVRGIPERIAEKTTDTAVSLLRIHGNRRFFMWIHYQDPHGPYTPPPRFGASFLESGAEARDLEFNQTVSGIGGIPSYQRLGDNRDFNYYVAQYDGEIRYFDLHFQRLVDALKAMDLYDNSLIIFTSDHGEGMGEHGYYFAHGEYVYESVIRVPLIVRYGLDLQGQRKDLVQLVDVVPTILDAAGLSANPGGHGRNLLSESREPGPVFSEMPGRYAVIKDGLKLIHHSADKEFLLFDIAADPDEDRNLIGAAEHRDEARYLAGRLQELQMEDRVGSGVRREASRLTEEEKEKLKALGYVQ
jgi:arylsulfatase A-like enzyme